MPINRSNWVWNRCEHCGKEFPAGPPDIKYSHDCPVKVLADRVTELEASMRRLVQRLL